jgi:serine/threonine-protein kinase
VLHRDLKPANVMLDADGRVRITDFGLAGLAGQIKDIRAGTPAYMAPEQLAGREVSIRSDIYALGLVLYEIFTGKRAFDAKNVAELLRMHDEGLALTPTAAVRDMDQAVERVILRCLERDPQRRPASALAVAASLPGGDPLAAALAAGETPSPELVANAGHREAIHPALGLSAVGVVLVLLTAVVLLLQQMLVMHRVPFDKPPDVLLDRARSVRTSFGYHDTPADSASGFDIDGDYYNYVQKSRQGADSWREISSGRDPLTRFWYRTSPSPLKTGDVRERVTSSEPPFSVAGMKNLALDSRGRLIGFEAIPSQAEASETSSGDVGPSGAPTRPAAPDATPTAPTAPNWDLLFAAAELPKDRFTPTEPHWTPRAFADTRAAWAGTLPELGDTPVRVEAASYGGRITGFSLVFPWTEQRAASTGDQKSFVETLGSYLHILIELALVLASVFIARRNLRLGRGNPAGAFRIAVFTFAVELVSLFLKGKHVPILDGEVDRWYSQVAYAVFEAGKIWIYYLALEPIVRRYWPDGLITWNRLLAGRWRDPLVGWHLLCGVGCGLALAATLRFGIPAIELIERGAASPWVYPIFFVGNARVFAGLVAGWINGGVNTGLFVVMCYAVARGSRAAMGRNIVALGVMGLILAAVLLSEFIIGKNLTLEISFMLLVVVVILVAMLQFGVLALCVMFIINNLMNVTPFTLSSADWFAPTSFATIAVVIGLAIAGFVISRGGEPLLGRAFAVE